MDFKSEIKVHNKFEVTVFDKDSGEVKQTAYAENIVLDAMYTQLCNFYRIFNGIAFGTGTGTLSASRTTLFNYLGWKYMTAADCGTVEEIKTFPTMSRKRKITIQPEEYVGKTITEVGIAVSYDENDNGMTFSKIVTHALLDTPIVKTATDIVVIEATLYFNFGEWETGFYGGNVKWRPASANDIVTYLFGTVMSAECFKIGTNPFFSNSVAEGLLASSASYFDRYSWIKDVANKKITTPVTRFAASAGNGAIKTFGLGSGNTLGIFTAILPLTGVFENYAITGEAVGTGDGVTTGFNLDWDDIDTVSKVYLDGVETTDYTLEKNISAKTITPVGLPSTTPSNAEAYCCAFSSDGKWFCAGTAWNIMLYQVQENIITYFHTKMGTGSNVISCAISPDGAYVLIGSSSSPTVTIYKNNDNGSVTKLVNPPSLPSAWVNGCDISPCGNYFAIAHDASPYVTIYKKSGDIFTKLDNPAVLPTGNGTGCKFSSCGNYFAVAHGNSPYITIYKKSGDIFTKLDNPAVLPTGRGYSCSFSQNADYLAVGSSSSPYINIYKRNGDVFTKLDNPDVIPGSTVQGCSLSPDGRYLALALSNSPYLIVYKRDGDVFNRIANPTSLPSQDGRSCAFSPNGEILAISSYGYGSERLKFYKFLDYTPSQAHNIEFTTPPAAGVVITADYTIDYIPKDANHVLDLSATIQWG